MKPVTRERFCGEVLRTTTSDGLSVDRLHFHLCGLPLGHDGEHFCWSCLAMWWLKEGMPAFSFLRALGSGEQP